MKWSKSFAKCQINQTPFYENENWEFAVSNNWHEICLMEQRLTLSWQFNRWVFCSALCLWEFRLNIFMDVTFQQLINVTPKLSPPFLQLTRWPVSKLLLCQSLSEVAYLSSSKSLFIRTEHDARTAMIPPIIPVISKFLYRFPCSKFHSIISRFACDQSVCPARSIALLFLWLSWSNKKFAIFTHNWMDY